MDENLLRFLMLAVFIAGTVVIAAISDELTSYSFHDPFEGYYPSMEFENVTALLDYMPLQEHVTLTGEVSHIDPDHTSDKGHIYQQIFITDGTSEVKVFCSTKGGRVEISVGDEIFVTGKFQKFYDNIEIYTECSDLDILE
jgi:RecG-like helicase